MILNAKVKFHLDVFLASIKGENTTSLGSSGSVRRATMYAVVRTPR